MAIAPRRASARYLIDTCILYELRKRAGADPRVRRWYEARSPDELYLSVVTVGEIRAGIERIRRRDPAHAARIEDWLRGLLADHGDRILPVDHEIAQQWGCLEGARSRSIADALIAATARVHGLTVTTRNVKDFDDAGTEVCDPFAPSPDDAAVRESEDLPAPATRVPSAPGQPRGVARHVSHRGSRKVSQTGGPATRRRGDRGK